MNGCKAKAGMRIHEKLILGLMAIMVVGGCRDLAQISKSLV
jgi:hypothetical protein